MVSVLFPACAITLVLLFLSPVPSLADVVLDINGKPLDNGGDYYILQRLLGTGGLTVTPGNDSSTCPLYIKQKPYSTGSPISIASLARIRFLTTGLPVYLYFHNVPSTCNDALRWWVAPKDSNGDSYVIVGVDSDKFKNTYFFTFEKAKGKYVYNIKFCHVLESRIMGTLFATEEQECNYVGFRNGYLAITPDERFPFAFKKVVKELAA